MATDMIHIESGSSVATDGSANKVGIGTTAPKSPLHVIQNNCECSSYSQTGSNVLILERDSDCGLMLITESGNESYILFSRPSAVSAGEIQYNHGDDSMRFITIGNEAMRIKSGGNVGIGTTNPGEKLHVSGSGAQAIKLDSTSSSAYFLADSYTGAEAGLLLREAGTNKWSVVNDGNDSDKLKINQAGTTNCITVTSDRKIGIGTTEPEEELHVIGDIQIPDSNYFIFKNSAFLSYDSTPEAFKISSRLLVGDINAICTRFYCDYQGTLALNVTGTPTNYFEVGPYAKHAVGLDGRNSVINAEGGSTHGGDNNGGHVVLMPGPGTGSGADGNVGVGTTSPDEKLSVSDTSNNTQAIFGQDRTSGTSQIVVGEEDADSK